METKKAGPLLTLPFFYLSVSHKPLFQPFIHPRQHHLGCRLPFLGQRGEPGLYP
jgi:hypothetical protein